MKFLSQDELPSKLRKLKNPPTKLYFEGDKALLNYPKVAIVGSRKASQYTKNMVQTLALRLKNAGVCVVSGGALGVHIVAHSGAFPYTIAVFGNGLDIIYPRTNAKILNNLYKNSLVLSEYEPSTPPLPHHFLERNRIVVALSKALVVAQADLRSGSMQSARMAQELGVPIYVLPQRYDESSGTNKLVNENKASLISDIDAFVSLFGEVKINTTQDDEIINFCKNGVSLDVAIMKFGDKIYDYELEGRVEIVNLTVKSI